MDAGTVLSLVLAGIGIVVGLAGVAGYLRGTAAKSRIEALQGDVHDWQARYEGQKEDLDLAKADLVEANHKIEEDRVRIKSLEDALSGKKEFEEIASVLRSHDQRARNIEQVVLAVADKVGLNTT